MANLEIEGKVFKVLDKVNGESKNGTWSKQDFVIETSGEYPKKVNFTAWGKLVDIASTLKANDVVKVSFNAESREYNERWYTELKAWQINVVNKSTKAEITQQATVPATEQSDEEDNLPF